MGHGSSFWLGSLGLEESTEGVLSLFEEGVPVEGGISSSLDLGELGLGWAVSLGLSEESTKGALSLFEEVVPVEFGIGLSLGIGGESTSGIGSLLGHSFPVDLRDCLGIGGSLDLSKLSM